MEPFDALNPQCQPENRLLIQLTKNSLTQDQSRKCSAWKYFVLETLKSFCGGGSRDYMVCKPILVFSLSLSQAEQQCKSYNNK